MGNDERIRSNNANNANNNNNGSWQLKTNTTNEQACVSRFFSGKLAFEASLAKLKMPALVIVVIGDARCKASQQIALALSRSLNLALGFNKAQVLLSLASN